MSTNHFRNSPTGNWQRSVAVSVVEVGVESTKCMDRTIVGSCNCKREKEMKKTRRSSNQRKM